MSSIGERLREERLRKGLSIEQIAENTRISPRYLEAIESGDMDRIPGKFFARSFLRQYALAVGLDENELSAELDRLTEAEPLPTAEDLERRPAERHIDVPPVTADGRPLMGQRTWASLGVFVVMVLACSLIYLFWQRSRQPSSPAAEAPQEQAANRPPAPQASAPPAAAPQTPTAGTETPAKEPAATGAEPQQPAAGAQPGQQAEVPPAPKPVPTEPQNAAPSGGGNGAVQLQLTASEPAWVRVTADGKVVMADTLKPGETKSFSASEAIRIRAGNAGALDITFNGKSVGPIGPKGQIRTVDFTPEGVHPVAPPPKPVAEPKPETEQQG